LDGGGATSALRCGTASHSYVYLRGGLPTVDLARRITEQARPIDGVRGVKTCTMARLPPLDPGLSRRRR